MNVKYTVITYDKVSDTFSISEDDDDDASEDNKEEKEVEELCHDLFKDFAATRENKRAKKSNEVMIGATSTKHEALEKVASDEALEKLVLYVISCGGKRDSLEGWSARRYRSGQWRYYSKEGKRFPSRPEVARWLELPGAPMLVQRTIENIASPEECKEALENLASYVVLCGGKRDLLEGWSARRYPSGIWYYCSKEGKSFTSRAKVARWFKLPGAPKVEKRTSTEPERQDEALARLALYVISCGGKRDSLEGWSARRNTSGQWNYYSEEGHWFTSHPEVARWLELPGALVQRTIENIASPEECKEALENLASYVISRGGKRDSLEGWSARRDTSRIWRYSKKGNIWFKCRPDVARWLNLPG
jgi:hypothetical protein